jgi:hydroxymethylpyrimidine kinase/phosphomethylpyrimidine kinase
MTSVLSIAGSDPSVAVTGVHEVPPEFVAAQIDAVFADIVPDAVKTGMLSSAAIIHVVAEKARGFGFQNLVVDPVMVAKSGDRLLHEDAVRALRDELIPLASVVTPNLPEAAAIAGHAVETLDGMREAARAIHALGAANVVVKGGHLAGDVVIDLLFDGERFHEFAGPRIPTKNTHGTGCTFASAIACYLARGEPVPAAVRKAKAYLTGALEHAYDTGRGHGSVNHMWAKREEERRRR